jgi:HK97 family phage portal protein
MRLLGLEITRSSKAQSIPAGVTPTLPSTGVGWGPGGSWWNWGWPTIREPFTGAWQRNMELRAENVLTYSAVYACVTLIASDIAKICLRLVEEDDNGVCTEVNVPAYSPLLQKPNRYQTRVKFIEQWMVSKLLYGNTYVLKERNARNTFDALYILDPRITRPLVAPDGSVFYQLGRDNLSGIEEGIERVPASEIIHDTYVPLYHPLCGITPLSACGLAAVQGLSIQNQSLNFFATGSHPGGVLTAPGMISDEVARRIKQHWDDNYTGANSGKVAVLGDGLKFERMSVNAIDAQLIDQLKWTSEQVCTAFHVPPYMVGVQPMPTHINNIEALMQQYYGQCLQILIESIETSLDDGLQLPPPYHTEFDLDDLLRMDSATKMTTITAGIKGGVYTPNEGRVKFDMPPVDGGDEVYLQQQNYSLSALAKRDAQADPFGTTAPAAPAAQSGDSPAPEPDQAGNQDATRNLAASLYRRSKQFRFRQNAA